MPNLLNALLVVFSAVISDLIFKKRLTYMNYMFMFILTFFLSLALNGDEQPIPKYNRKPVEFYFSDADRDHYICLAIGHVKCGNFWYMDAYDRCCTYPCFTDSEKAIECMKALVATCASPSLRGKAVSSLVCLLSSYSIACMEEWHGFRVSLMLAAYHYEMAEFYEDVLKLEKCIPALMPKHNKPDLYTPSNPFS